MAHTGPARRTAMGICALAMAALGTLVPLPTATAATAPATAVSIQAGTAAPAQWWCHRFDRFEHRWVPWDCCRDRFDRFDRRCHRHHPRWWDE